MHEKPAVAVTTPIATATAVEETPDLDTAAAADEDAPARVDEESFESATPTDLPRADLEPEVAAVPTAAPANGRGEYVAARPVPPLDQIVAKLPPETRQVLDDLFRARFTTVRRIRPEQLR